MNRLLSIRKFWVALPWTQRAVFIGAIGISLLFVYKVYKDRPRDFVQVADAKNHIGEVTHICGKVFGIKPLRDGKVIVDFGDFYPRQKFTAIFTHDAYADVREEHGGIKLGDIVTVHGVVDSVDGLPRMIVGNAGDVITETDASDQDDDSSNR
jgi:hypothetical protein